ncbi:hypothetical protein KKA14_19165 [bacterium]|nr:hypothetical protein [bacterium]
MAVKILISRKINTEQEAVVRPFLKQLHQCALKHKGYISGESLISADDLEDHLIISSWESLDYWETFLEIEETKEIRFTIDQILGRETIYRIFYKQ